MLRVLPLRRSYTTAAAAASKKEAWLYLDSVFPVQLALWDFRHYIGILRQDTLLNTLESRLHNLSSVHDFKPLEIQPHRKDGGVFVRFSYSTSDLEEGKEWPALQAALSEEVEKQGGLPTWAGVRTGTLWVVRGSPWKEDMNRFASPLLRVAFDGPDIQEQSLYDLCRPYGRIRDLSSPTPVPAGTLRSSLISFQHVHSATIARNVIHGLELPSTSGPTPSKTRIHTRYETPVKAHDIRNWMSNHPKIMLPIIIFLLGTLTYTIFDPIRSVMVKAKMLDWFDYRKFRLYEWLRVNTVERLSSRSDTTSKAEGEVWKERKEAESALKAYLSDMPTTIAFIHGPAGSGKITMLNAVLKQSGRTYLIIDCRKLNNAPSESALVEDLATQTGYWPVFNFVNSMGNLIDLASVAGLSSSLPEQLKQILEVVTTALRSVSSAHRASIQRQIQNKKAEDLRRIQDAHKRQAIISGTWHDGRLDCVSGNGVISELGVGDELFSEDMEAVLSPAQLKETTEDQDNILRKQKALEDVEAIKALPIVVIRNYAAGTSSKEDVLDVLAQWGAALAENHIAHVIVLSDNRENSKRLAKALPTKPLNSIALSDADPSSSLSFVKQKLHDAGVDIGISAQETHLVERLGGRASDLESLIHKVRSGMKVDEAVEDIISRGVAELRKNAFGEDTEDAKSLPWTRYQAWKVLKTLSKTPETGYYDILVDFPFKGDENALRSMEHAELISISTKDDKIFQATQELAYNEKQILDTETKIQGYEQELSLLVSTMEKERRPWWSLRRSPLTMESLKATLTGIFQESAVLSKDAVLSNAWSYPLLGITYLVSHPVLYKSIAPVITKAVLTSVGITAGLFFFTYLPQVAFCALFSGPFAFITAAVMVFSEAYVLVSVVSKAFFLNAAQDRIFDAVLLQQGNQTLVESGRQIRSSSSGFKVLGRSLTKPLDRFSKDGILRYVVSLPLNSIPGVGTALFLLYNGIKAGPGFHSRYFQLKKYDSTTRQSFVESRKGAYTAFGATALALNLVPVIGLLFNITSTIGAALWANKLEKTGASPEGSGRKVDKVGQSANDIPVKDQYEVRLED
ncbi:hypothetical protein CVT25_015512 [Psilocybe cyanescens]|uniref:Mitochondrial escape protein 2 n=1 Tax=Psilocybe cyanescens TaxID=93625 RepID=A0A409WI56_PSICY|nr:hypothetical protein CVT25_015512 [Psilocybe cyanescens]